MRKLLTISTRIFFALAVIGVFITQISFRQGKLILVPSLVILILLFSIRIYREKISLKKIVLNIALFFGLALVSFYGGVLNYVLHEKVCQSEKPVEYREWKNIRELDLPGNLDRILEHSDKFDISVLLKVDYLSDTFNVYSIRFNANQKHNILILTGMHGSEPAGVSAIPLIINEITSSPDKYDRLNIEIVFPLNPVGLKNFSRLNECGCDINRDFRLFKTSQSRLISSLFQNNKYDLVLDLHEGSYLGHAILTNNIVDDKLIKYLNSYLQKNNIAQSQFNAGNGSRIDTFLQFYKYDNLLSRFGEPKMIFSFADDCNLMYLTSESDGYSEDYDKRVTSHLLMFKGIIDYYIASGFSFAK